MENIQHGRSQATKPEIHRAKSGTESCALCGRSGDLQESHIIPKFVGKWIKDTSATGFLASATDGERLQDLPTIRMLCSDCELRFSKLEKSFAGKIFHPFHKSNDIRLEYGSWLEPFAVSLGWRVLTAGYEAVSLQHPSFYSQMAHAEATWREFLLDDKQTVSPYESHILFLDSVKTSVDAPERFVWYSRRATGWGVFTTNNRIFTYAILPGMAFVTSIHPEVLTGWKGTRINQSGVIPSPHTIDDDEFWRFLLNDAEEALAPATRSSPEVQRKWLQKALQKDPKRFLESDTTQILTDEMVSRYKRRMAGMPWFVTRLINVIGNQMAGTKAETVYNIWRSKKIFNALADLSAEEAAKLDSGIQNAIDLLMATGRSTKYRLTANTIRITFIANHNSTKADQRAAIVKELVEIEAERSNNEIPLAVVSMNYEDDGVSFESGFMVPPDSAL